MNIDYRAEFFIFSELISPNISAVKLHNLLTARPDKHDGRFVQIFSLALANKNITTEILSVLLKFNTTVFTTTEYVFNPIHEAVKNPRMTVDILRLLVRAGASVNQTAYHCCFPTPLLTVLGYHDIPSPVIVKELLDLGAKVNAETLEGENSLHIALKGKNCSAIVKELLKHGANVNSKNGLTHQTPLHIAIAYDSDPEIVKALVQSGADIEALSMSKETPLSIACKLYEKRRLLYDTTDTTTLNDTSWDNVLMMIKYHLINKKQLSLKKISEETSRLLKSIVEDYRTELCSIRSCIFYSDFSLNEVLIGDCDLKFYPDHVVDSVLKMLCGDFFPIYGSDLLNAIDISVLMDKMERLLPKWYITLASGGTVNLNRYCVREVCLYLSKQDLLNVLKSLM